MRWRPSPLTLAILTCVGGDAGRGGDRITAGSSWRSSRRCSACCVRSVGSGRLPTVRRARTTRVAPLLRDRTGAGGGVGDRRTRDRPDAVDLAVVDGGRHATRGRRARSRRRQTVDGGRRPLGPLPDPGAGSPSARAADCLRARASSTPPTSSCSRSRRRSRRRSRGPICSTASAPTSPGTSALASSTPTSAATCPVTNCARSTGR